VIAERAARLKSKNPLEGKRKTDLTLTGLLMEGFDIQNLAMHFGALCREQEKRTMRETEVQVGDFRIRQEIQEDEWIKRHEAW
jgi:hypothetical protein